MEEKKFKQHFSSIIENTITKGWLIITFIIISSLDNFFEIINNNLSLINILIGLSSIFIIILIIFIYFFIEWKKTEITINNKMISTVKDTINKKYKNIALTNIATVDISQTLIGKIFNTAILKIDTNTFSTGKKEDLKIILSYSDALYLQKHILKLMNKEEVSTSLKLEEYDAEFSSSAIFKHAIFNIKFSLLLSAIISSSYLFMADNISLTTLIIPLLIFIVPVFTKFAFGIIRYHDFKVKREEDKILMSYGLLTKKKYTIPLNKINGIKIVSPTIGRIFKKYYVEIINIGIGDSEEEISILLPSLSLSEIKEYLKVLLPELNLNLEFNKVSKKSILAILIDNIIWYLILIFITTLFSIWTIIPVTIFFLIVIILSYITEKYNIEENKIVIVSGIFTKKIIYIDPDKIEFIEIQKNFIAKKFNISKVKIHILANLINTIQVSGYINDKDLSKLIDKY